MDFNSKLFKKEAGGFSRIMQMMNAQIPSVHTLGIMSVDNPQGEPATAEANNKAREDFKKQLKRSLYGYVQQSGQFGGSKEKSTMIMNITKKDLEAYGKQYDQQSVIFATIDPVKKEIKFEYIENGTTLATQTCVVGLKNNTPDMFSEYKGRKFLIPFFDGPDSEEEGNLPKGAPFTEEQVNKHEANLPHIAVINKYANDVRLIAMGRKVGMSVIGARGMTLRALRHLKVD